MKHIILGDIHGRSYWQLVALKETYDKLVFVGDYFDSFDIKGPEQLKNFENICKFKRDNPDKVVLLIGNHDFHYTPIAMAVGEDYSGYNGTYCWHFQTEIQLNADILQMSYLYKDFLITHAGVTNTWLKRTLGLQEDDTLDMSGVDIEEYINNVYKYTPKYFFFVGQDSHGDDITQSPIWVRPQSLMEDAFGDYRQIVGHTIMGKINPDGIDGKFFFIDTMAVGEYLVIEDDKTYKAQL